MDELIRQLGQYSGTATATVSMAQTVVAVLLSFLLALITAFVYKATHTGTSYSQSFFHTLVIMAVVVSLIMIIIGSNIARAFSLVGALSIIRFRSAIKESRDVAFIFLTMAIGMACGTQFYDVAIVFTVLMAGIVFLLSKLNLGAKDLSEVMLTVQVRKGLDYENVFGDLFYRDLRSFALLSAESVADQALEIVYTIALKPKVAQRDFLDAVQEVDGCERASLVTGAQNIGV
jgi:uncharacterized membrane protein YhiD involved in acid resistance